MVPNRHAQRSMAANLPPAGMNDQRPAHKCGLVCLCPYVNKFSVFQKAELRKEHYRRRLQEGVIIDASDRGKRMVVAGEGSLKVKLTR